MPVDIFREMWQLAMAMLAERDARILAQDRLISAMRKELRGEHTNGGGDDEKLVD